MSGKGPVGGVDEWLYLHILYSHSFALHSGSAHTVGCMTYSLLHTAEEGSMCFCCIWCTQCTYILIGKMHCTVFEFCQLEGCMLIKLIEDDNND